MVFLMLRRSVFWKIFWKSNSTYYNDDMSKLIPDYLMRSCYARLSTEEPSSLSTVEHLLRLSLSNVQTSRALHINEEKSTNENNESIPVQFRLVLIILSQWKNLERKNAVVNSVGSRTFPGCTIPKKNIFVYLYIFVKFFVYFP